jgi:hypothetical protein
MVVFFLLQSVTVCICSSHFAGCQGLTGVAQAHPHPMAHLEVIETSITRWVMLFGCIICHGLKGRGKGCRQQTTSLISCTILYQEAEWFLSTACRNTMKHPQRSIKQFRSLETTDDTAEISKGGSPDSLEGFVEALCCQWVWYFFSTSSTVSWLLQGHLEDLNRMASKPLWHGFGHAPSLFFVVKQWSSEKSNTPWTVLASGAHWDPQCWSKRIYENLLFWHECFGTFLVADGSVILLPASRW